MTTPYLSSKQILTYGLSQLGTDEHSQAKRKEKYLEEEFLAKYGTTPKVVAIIWDKLNTTINDNIRLKSEEKKLDKFLQALHWMKTYPTEMDLANSAAGTPKTIRKWILFFGSKIQALKAELVRL